MKKIILGLLTVSVLLLACQYDVPITTAHEIPINKTLIGNWQWVAEDEEDNSDAEMRIFRFSDTEYLIQYFEHKASLYFRGYQILIGGVSAVQLELLGSDDESVSPDDEDLFMVASYQMVDGELEVKTLNTNLINDELTDSESLRKAFIEHEDHPELFNDPGRFKRMD